MRLRLRAAAVTPVLLILAGTVARIPRLTDSVYERNSFRQSQTASVVREFLESGFDPSTPLPIFGPGTRIPFEFPIFQWIAAQVARIGGLDPSSASRITSLFWFQLAVAALYVLMRRIFGHQPAMIALILAQLLPFGLQWGHAALIEFMPVALILWAAVLLGATRTRTTALAVTLLCVLAALTKITTFVALSPLLIIDGVLSAPRDRVTWPLGPSRLRQLVLPGAAGGVAVLAALVWTTYADRVKLAIPETAGLTSAALRGWNFGTMEQRLDPAVWSTVLGHLGGVLPPSALVLLLLAGLREPRTRSTVLLFAAPPVIGIGVFFNLYYRHDYYLSAVVLPMIAVMAIGIHALLPPGAAARLGRPAVTLAAAVGLGILSLTDPTARAYSLEFLLRDPSSPELAHDVARITGEDDVVIAFACDWSPELHYFSDRTFYMALPGGPVVTSERLPGARAVAYCSDPAEGYAAHLSANLQGFEVFGTDRPDVFLVRADRRTPNAP